MTEQRAYDDDLTPTEAADDDYDDDYQEPSEAAKSKVDDDFDDDDEEAEDPADDGDLTPVYGQVDLAGGRCEISLHLSIPGVTTLDQALDAAAASLGRFGMDPFYILAFDPVSERRWVINQGRVMQEPDASDDDDDQPAGG